MSRVFSMLTLCAVTAFGYSQTVWAEACGQSEKIDIKQYQAGQMDLMASHNAHGVGRAYAEENAWLNALNDKVGENLDQQVDYLRCMRIDPKQGSLMASVSSDGSIHLYHESIDPIQLRLVAQNDQ